MFVAVAFANLPPTNFFKKSPKDLSHSPLSLGDMTDQADFEQFERDLALVSVQCAPPVPRPADIQHRVRRAFWRPLRAAHVGAILIAGFIVDEAWGFAAALAALLVLRYLSEVRDERRKLASLDSTGALDEHTQADARDWLTHLRGNVVFFAFAALGSIAWSVMASKPSIWLVVAAVSAGFAVYEGVVLLPIARRAYRDTGATGAHSWPVIVFTVMLLPVDLPPKKRTPR